MSSAQGDHGLPTPMRYALIESVLSHTRVKSPKTVHYRTHDLRWNKAYWVEIDELLEDYRPSQVTATIVRPGRVKLEMQNVSRLTLDLDAIGTGDGNSLVVSIRTDRAAADLLWPLPEDCSQVHLVRSETGMWGLGKTRYREGLVKRHGLSGPMTEALGDRFIIVYGTAGDEDATAANRETAEAYAEGLKGLTWGRMWGSFRVIADNALSEADVATSHLILYGGPDTNTFTARIADNLPVTLENAMLTFRGRTYDDPGAAVEFIYPNPANPDRYVLVNCGARPEAIRNIAAPYFSRCLPDWMTFDTESAERARRQEGKPFAEAGYFDRDWR
jgi:hypothetical protein